MSSATITISGDLIGHVHLLYQMTLDHFLEKGFPKNGINGYSEHAYPAYIMSVAAVEAFLNENFLSTVPKLINRESPIWKLPKDWIERLELGNKLILVPQLLFGNSLARDSQPLQDMLLLIKVRNDLIHYKMSFNKPTYLKHLDDQGISLKAGVASETQADYPWASKLQSSEGIRWAHNTACYTINSILNLIPENKRIHIVNTAANFKPIEDNVISNWFNQNREKRDVR